MISHFRKSWILIFPTLTLAQLVGCGGGSNNSTPNSAVSPTIATGTSYISGVVPTTVNCTGSLTVSAVNTSSGAVAQSTSVTSGTSFQLTVPPATYTVTATNTTGCSASASTTTTAGSNQTVSLVEGGTTTVPVTTTTPTTVGTGTATVSGYAPNGGACIGTITISLLLNGTGSAVQSTSVAAGSTFSISMSPGYYLLQATGGNGCNVSVPVNSYYGGNSTVVLYPNLTSLSTATGLPTIGTTTPYYYPTGGYYQNAGAGYYFPSRQYCYGYNCRGY